ncbi:MAG: 50S ribosomal protein L1 [Candidatus Dojkabacteria bacterium]
MAKTKVNYLEKYNLNKTKSIADGVKIALETVSVKFTPSIDIDIVLNLKDKQKKESIRGSVDLPVTFGKEKRVVVLTTPNNVEAAKKAGAVEAGLDDLKQKILNGKIEFDVIIATPDVMPKIVELGKVLGPRGLMPNPKNGTVTNDIEKAVDSFKGGKVNFKMEQGQGVIRAKVGQADMKPEEIVQNIEAFLKAVATEAKKIVGQPFKKVTISTTMGHGIRIDFSDII